MKIKAGDEVVIVQSPYSCVKIGTIAIVEKVIPNHFMPEKQSLIVLAGLMCSNFREHEIIKTR